MQGAPQTLKSRLYHLETINDEDCWVEKCQGYPIFKKEEGIFRMKYYSLPERELCYDIAVDTNIYFQRNENGIQWTMIKENQVMAISFRQELSANAFWQLIEQYQKKYAIEVPAAQGILFYFQYRVPSPTPDNLEEFYKELQMIPELQRYERVVSIFLTKRDLLPKLISVFKILDDNQDLPKLQVMFKIIRLIFNSSNQQLLYEMMCNDSFLSVLGALECFSANNKPKHREFMRYQSKLLEVVPFKNIQMLNLVILTYRLEFVKQCVLFPYLNDYSFTCTNYILKNNYRKILNHVFNPKKKDFINSLFDLLRMQNIMAFKLLRQIFRIAKSVNVNDLYGQIAERDFFDILLCNVKEYRSTQQIVLQKSKKNKKKPEYLEDNMIICIQILEQFMDFQPQHFRNYCASENQKIMKYPICEFLLQEFENCTPILGSKMGNILKALIGGTDHHILQEVTHEKILYKFMEGNGTKHFQKWIQVFNSIISPQNSIILNNLTTLVNLLLNNLDGPKSHQIDMINGLKELIYTYMGSQQDLQRIMLPQVQKLVNYLVYNKGAMGIRISIFLSIFRLKSSRKLTQELIKHLQDKNNTYILMKYEPYLKGLLNRKDVILPSHLKREKSEKLIDEEQFERIQKKIKVQ